MRHTRVFVVDYKSSSTKRKTRDPHSSQYIYWHRVICIAMIIVTAAAIIAPVYSSFSPPPLFFFSISPISPTTYPLPPFRDPLLRRIRLRHPPDRIAWQFVTASSPLSSVSPSSETTKLMERMFGTHPADWPCVNNQPTDRPTLPRGWTSSYGCCCRSPRAAHSDGFGARWTSLTTTTVFGCRRTLLSLINNSPPVLSLIFLFSFVCPTLSLPLFLLFSLLFSVSSSLLPILFFFTVTFLTYSL